MDFAKFRVMVDVIPKPKDRVLIQALYLLAARASELCCKTIPSELKHGGSKPYGLFSKYGFADFEIKQNEVEKALICTTAVAKRGKRKKADRQASVGLSDPAKIAELLPSGLRADYEKDPASVDPLLVQAFSQKMIYKAVALPTSTKYEPWTRDILLYISKRGALNFPICRHTALAIVKRHLFPLGKNVHAHTLRHWRLTHLAEIYGFDGYELSLVAGWSFRTGFSMMGMAASSNLDTYLHLTWRKSFSKLLKPLPM